MTDYQVTSWRDLPSMVAARDGEQTAKAQLPQRFQEAIDEAAMRLGDTGADDYLAGWTRGEWTPADGELTAVLEQQVRDLDEQWPADRVERYLDALGEAR